jgi:Carboxypeptidase regulatory-like domain
MARLFAVLVGIFVLASTSLAEAQAIFVSSGDSGLFGGIVANPGQAPPRDNQQAKPGTATVRGRVVAGDSGQPLRKAQVRIMANISPGSTQLPESRLVTTDASGRYEFKELPAGRYNLTASKGVYVSLQYGQLRPFEPGKPLEVLDGQTLERIDFALPRGSVITGRVLDEFGEPVSDVQVSAMRYQFTPAGRQLAMAGRQATTNDIGEYRLFALAPGDYYVSATLRGANTFERTDDRSGYAPTYYPSTADTASAQRLTVGVGQTLSEISISLLPIRTARISGTAVDSQGRPMTGLVMAVPRLGFFGGPFGLSPAQIRPDGSFTINGLTPGEYTLQVQSQPFADQTTAESASADVTVGGSDINDLRLVASKPSNGSGRIVFSDPAAAQSLRSSGVRVMPAPTPTGGIMFGPAGAGGAVGEDWTFQIKLRPGSTRINVVGQPAGWVLKAIRHQGNDVTDAGIDVKPNEDVTEIEVELTNRITEVSGLVTNGRGDPSKDYWAIVFARDHQKWQPTSRYIRTARPDQDGRFKISGLPAGDYLAVALDFIEQGQANDPEFLDRIQDRAVRFSLGENEAKTLDLKLGSLP